MKTVMSKIRNNFVYRPPSGDNNKDEPSLEELLGRLNIKIPKIPGLGSGSPFLGLIIILVVLVGSSIMVIKIVGTVITASIMMI